MSTMLHVRTARTRKALFRLASSSMLLACLGLLASPVAGLAQRLPSAEFSVSKNRESKPSVEKRLALAEAYRANPVRKLTQENLNLFIDRARLSNDLGEMSTVSSSSLHKGSSSVFDDVQLIPDQTFENSQGWGAPALVAISEELIGMAYTDQGVSGGDFFGTPEVGPRILFRTSSDGGASWSDPIVVANDADFILDYNWVSIAINAGGRLSIIDETPFEENHAFYSDDFGATWTEVAYEETDFLDAVLGPVNGQFWRQSGPAYPNQTNVQYETSDDGVSWSDPQVMIPSVGTWTEATLTSIARTGGSNYIAAFNLFTDEPECCEGGIGVSRSTDNGATWTAIEHLDPTDMEERSPAVASDGAGNVYLAFFMPNPETVEDLFDFTVYTVTSEDGGTTFGDIAPYTRYLGDDINPAIAMAGNDPLLAFQSGRGTMYFRMRVWYGLAGSNQTPDADPAPLAFWYSNPSGWIPANREFPVRLVVYDETGVDEVLLRTFRDGDELEPLQLFDDGQHDDIEAGDGVFGGMTQGLDYGSPVMAYPEAMDSGGNLGFGFPVNATVATLHDVGELVTVVSPEGGMGSETLQDFSTGAPGVFPKSGDAFAFLPYAGVWVGINKAPGKRVSHLFYDNLFGPEFASPTLGDWQVVDYPTEGPGESELDVVMHYNDSGAPHPIGLGVVQTTYQWSDANYVILDYVFTNQSGGDLTGLYAGMVMDADIPLGADPFDDQVGYDADRALIYSFDGGTWCSQNNPSWCTDLHAGVALLSDGTDLVGKSVPTPFTAHRWSGFSQGDPQRHPNTGLDANAYDILTSGIWAGFNLGLTTVADEWRMVLTAQPFDLAAGASHRVVFGMVAGAGEGGILASTDAMIERFNTAVLAVEQTGTVPSEFALGQNYPNPFNPTTTIPFSVESTSPVSLTVFDVLGRQIDRIVNETLSAGSYRATFESKSLPSGAYYYTLTADGQSITKSMFLLK